MYRESANFDSNFNVLDLLDLMQCLGLHGLW